MGEIPSRGEARELTHTRIKFSILVYIKLPVYQGAILCIQSGTHWCAVYTLSNMTHAYVMPQRDTKVGTSTPEKMSTASTTFHISLLDITYLSASTGYTFQDTLYHLSYQTYFHTID